MLSYKRIKNNKGTKIQMKDIKKTVADVQKSTLALYFKELKEKDTDINQEKYDAFSSCQRTESDRQGSTGYGQIMTLDVIIRRIYAQALKAEDAIVVVIISGTHAITIALQND